MRLRFVWIGPTRNRHCRELEGQYRRRLSRFFSVDAGSVKEERKTDPRQQKAMLDREALAVEKKLKGSGCLVVLDEKGKQLSSVALARFLESRMQDGTQELAFVVGGHSGVSRRLNEAADLRLSLSLMTLPHELARVVLLEQLYRAASLLKGLPYHR